MEGQYELSNKIENFIIKLNEALLMQASDPNFDYQTYAGDFEWVAEDGGDELNGFIVCLIESSSEAEEEELISEFKRLDSFMKNLQLRAIDMSILCIKLQNDPESDKAKIKVCIEKLQTWREKLSSIK